MSNWVQVVGFPDYEVSDAGEVRSHRRKAPVPMVPRIGRGGYHRVLLRDAFGAGNMRSIHRLALEAFVGPCPDGMEACHNNGNRTDNRLSNLRWDTKAGNARDRFKHGTDGSGERNGSSRLTLLEAESIRAEVASGACRVDVAVKYGVTPSLVSQIVLGRAWKSAGGPRSLRSTRGARGERMRRKLTESAVIEMRALRASGASIRELAERYGVSGPSVSNICLGNLWKHVPMAEGAKRRSA